MSPVPTSPPLRGGDRQGAPEGGTQALGLASPPECVRTCPWGARAGRESGVLPRHSAPTPRPGGRCRAGACHPGVEDTAGAAPAPGHPGSLRVNPLSLVPPRDRRWLNPVNEWRGARQSQRVPVPPGQGPPAPRLPPGTQGVKSGRAGPGADVFGLCSWERKRPRAASALLVLRGKQEKKKRTALFPGHSRLILLCIGVSPQCGTGDRALGAEEWLAGTGG